MVITASGSSGAFVSTVRIGGGMRSSGQDRTDTPTSVPEMNSCTVTG